VKSRFGFAEAGVAPTHRHGTKKRNGACLGKEVTPVFHRSFDYAEIVEGIFETFGLDTKKETPGRQIAPAKRALSRDGHEGEIGSPPGGAAWLKSDWPVSTRFRRTG
jgi:hypothetical protein